jgi:hypothetical protein
VIANWQEDNLLSDDEILLTDAALILINFGFLRHHHHLQQIQCFDGCGSQLVRPAR